MGSVISEDYGVATERQCMTRAPSDNKERCAYVVYRGKQASSSQQQHSNSLWCHDIMIMLVAGVHVLLQG